ncbi:SlyX family protein [Endozoicomonas sp. ONNA2]|uniref:SlyX family protein n=1 Tax=Endozoicomonas sp. ONNA2 TaxID=2828741 RepID=UPI002148135B|nr:SlyX family protein [Endozoicomonas sp. ONNA2]
MQNELLELQTQLSYQEDTIAQLNEVVTRQQKDIDRLKEAMAQLKKQFEEMVAEQLESQEELLPPHY